MELAKRLCKIAHRGQKDKAGKDYFNHPYAVADLCKTTAQKTVAYMHDIVEDTSFTIQDLTDFGFSENIVKAVDAMTHRKEDSYEEYLEKLKKNKTAVAVKIADLTHNSDITRIPNPTEKDFARVERYKKYLEYLKN